MVDERTIRLSGGGEDRVIGPAGAGGAELRGAKRRGGHRRRAAAAGCAGP